MTAAPIARRMARVTPSAIMELIKTTAAGNYISFASGLPDPTLYPIDTLRGLLDQILTTDGERALQYGPAEGHPPLRAWVADRLRQRGLPATPEHILITHGSQQALDLVGRAFLDPGDPVLLESPSYLAAIQVFDSYEAQYLPVSADEAGMQTEEAVRLLRERRPKLIFTLPNFQNPSGATMTLDRRRQLAEAAAGAEIPLLEDDAYHDLRYDGDALPPVTALAENPWGVYTGTFSKTIVPGIRVGYLYAQPHVTAKLAQLKQITDLHSSSLAQRLALRFCEEGLLDPQIRALCATYGARRDTMLQELDARFGGLATWTRPAGGMFVLVTLGNGADTTELLPAVLERGVVFVPGETFFPDGRGRHTLRLNFVSAQETDIRRGLTILADVLANRA